MTFSEKVRIFRSSRPSTIYLEAVLDLINDPPETNKRKQTMTEEQGHLRDDTNVVEPYPKRVKTESEPPTLQEEIPKLQPEDVDCTQQQSMETIKIEAATTSPSPAPLPLTSISRSDVQAQIDQLKNEEVLQQPHQTDASSPAMVVKSEIKPTTDGDGITTSVTSSTIANVPSQAEIVSRTGRNIEDIIDGSDLRRFLNKTLAEYLVKGLDEIVQLWESGEFDIKEVGVESNNQQHLEKKVLRKFADILKDFAED